MFSLYIFTHTDVKHDFHIIWCSGCLSKTTYIPCDTRTSTLFSQVYWCQTRFSYRKMFGQISNTTDVTSETGTVTSQFLVMFVFFSNWLSVYIIVSTFDHCIFCLSIDGFWLPLRYLQTFLTVTHHIVLSTAPLTTNSRFGSFTVTFESVTVQNIVRKSLKIPKE